MKTLPYAVTLFPVLILSGCSDHPPASEESIHIERETYRDQFIGFWLGSCIANWTGLTTEAHRRTKPYYTDEDWQTTKGWTIDGKEYSFYIDFVLDQDPWGADDDTDIEYIFQHAMDTYATTRLSGAQIRDQWLEHIRSEEENYLWVSNETAFHLMRDQGMTPPETSLPANNPNWEMIDAQLVTEIFGLYAPGHPDLALTISEMPVRTMAYSHSQYAAQFYIVMHALASRVDPQLSYKEQVFWLAAQARGYIPDSSYIAGMYDWVLEQYHATPDKNDWETVRDAFHDRYIEGGADGYSYADFFDSGSNFGLSMVSLFFGEGNFKRTIQIGTLAGQDSDNPTATWGGLLGFLYGYEGLQTHFEKRDFSNDYHIHRTRIGFGDGMDTFDSMAETALRITERVIREEMNGTVSEQRWVIPVPQR